MNLQYSGEEKIAASPATVWAFVTDPEKVGRCLPDVVDVTVQDADALRCRRARWPSGRSAASLS